MQKARALDGVKILDFTWVAVGPTITSCLGDFGATVIKVESHTRPEVSRVVGPFKGKPSIDSSGYFTHHNSSKYSLTLNLRHPKGKEVALKLIEWADVVTESMTPGVMKRLGLDYESAKEVKPDIIYFSTSLQGQYGRRSRLAGFGQLGCALSGIWYLTGSCDHGPAPPEGAYLDYIAPRFGVVAILAALEYRRRIGIGQFIDLSQTETGIHSCAPVIMEYLVNNRVAERCGNRSPRHAPHGAFPCRGDDAWVAIAVGTDDEWDAFCRVIGDHSWTKEPRFSTLLGRKQNENELERLVAEWTILHTSQEITDWLQSAGVPASIVESNKDLFEDPQLKHRKHFWVLEHPVMGQYSHDNQPFRLSKTPNRQFAAPTMGQHNEYVLREILGMSDNDVARLIIDGAITTEGDLPAEW